MSDSNANQYNMAEGESGLYDHLTPLVGYTLKSNQSLLKMFSMRNNKSLHVIRFNSPVIKF